MPVILKANLSDYPPPDPIFRHLLAPPCAACGLSPLRSNGCSHKVVPPIGNIRTAKILLCLQSPGETEDYYGLPVCGPYHSFAQDVAKAAGFNGLTSGFWEQFVIANALWCHPPGDRAAKGIELPTCRNNMNLLLQAMDVKLAVLVGQDALTLFEGKESKMHFRHGCPSGVSWLDEFGREIRKFGTFPLYHPGRIRHIKNEFGKRVAEQEYKNAVAWIGRAAKEIAKGKDLFYEPAYQYELCETETEALGKLEQLRDSKPLHVAFDYETWAINRVHIQPIGLAVSYEALSGFYIPMKKCVGLPESAWHKVKVKANASWLLKYGLEDYFSPGFIPKMVELLRPVLEGENRPFVTAQHAQIEKSIFDDLGLDFDGRPEQFLADPEIPCFDTLALARGVFQCNSVKLATILQICSPLEYKRKDYIEETEFEKRSGKTGVIRDKLSENELSATGFGLFSIKPPGLISELKSGHNIIMPPEFDPRLFWWHFPAEKTKIEVLAERACFDADAERRVAYTLAEMAFGSELRADIDVDKLFHYQKEATDE